MLRIDIRRQEDEVGLRVVGPVVEQGIKPVNRHRFWVGFLFLSSEVIKADSHDEELFVKDCRARIGIELQALLGVLALQGSMA